MARLAGSRRGRYELSCRGKEGKWHRGIAARRWRITICDRAWNSTTMICENNIFVTDDCAIKMSARSANFSGSHNIYFRLDGSSATNVPQGTGILTDPQFVNLKEGDFRIRITSPAAEPCPESSRRCPIR